MSSSKNIESNHDLKRNNNSKTHFKKKNPNRKQ